MGNTNRFTQVPLPRRIRIDFNDDICNDTGRSESPAVLPVFDTATPHHRRPITVSQASSCQCTSSCRPRRWACHSTHSWHFLLFCIVRHLYNVSYLNLFPLFPLYLAHRQRQFTTTGCGPTYTFVFKYLDSKGGFYYKVTVFFFFSFFFGRLTFNK